MRTILAAIAAVFVMNGSAYAALIGTTDQATISGGWPIRFYFSHDYDADLTQLIINGATGQSGGITWQTINGIYGSAVLAENAIGIDTEQLVFNFSSFGRDDNFILWNIDPDFTEARDVWVEQTDLIGVWVTAVFSDGTRYSAFWVDDPDRNRNALMLAEVPLPGALVLFLTGLGGFAFSSRKQKAA